MLLYSFSLQLRFFLCSTMKKLVSMYSSFLCYIMCLMRCFNCELWCDEIGNSLPIAIDRWIWLCVERSQPSISLSFLLACALNQKTATAAVGNLFSRYTAVFYTFFCYLTQTHTRINFYSCRILDTDYHSFTPLFVVDARIIIISEKYYKFCLICAD